VLHNLYLLGILAVADWLIATTIARARVFRPLRTAVLRRSAYLGEGISCQFCISHWVGFALTGIYRPRFIQSDWLWIDLIVSAFMIIGVGALIARNLGKTPSNGVHPDCKPDTVVIDSATQAWGQLLKRTVVRND
jgi:hypothetical protein